MAIEIKPTTIIKIEYQLYGIILTGETPAIPPITSNWPAYGNKPLNAEENTSNKLAVREREIPNSSEYLLLMGLLQ
ncbi:MAG: hypothetical protein ACFWT6_12905 [Virgibacillus proomii]